MIRASGIFLGVSLTLVVLILTVNAGYFSPSMQEAGGGISHTHPQLASAGTSASVYVESAIENEPLPAAAKPNHPEEHRLVQKAGELEPVPRLRNQSPVNEQTANGDDATQVSLYPVWSPFHSERAARGFARRLAVATGVPVEVVSDGPANYQVTLSYRDDDERQAMVERIKTVTGIELE
jgi:hypothetical protein